KYSPLHFVDCYHKMMGVQHRREGEKLLINTDHNALAFSNINSIRKSQGGFEGTAKIIGIQLKTADTSKDISEETIIQLIKSIKMNIELVPILLIAPTEEEKKYAANINEKSDNELIIIEADLQAIASVLMNID